MAERQITLREATPEDMEFLARLYFDTRRQEVSAWGWPPEQQELFLRMQFDAQSRSYRAAFSDATDRIICLDGSAVGRMLVGQEPGAMHLVDIALLEEHRNCGIGTSLLRQLLQECEMQDRTLRLQVLQGNPAIRLYQRMGFVQSGADPMYVQMEWTPPRLPERS
jgi:ribosomal protein S18 acetylase RimI-like enzyme